MSLERSLSLWHSRPFIYPFFRLSIELFVCARLAHTLFEESGVRAKSRLNVLASPETLLQIALGLYEE